MSLDLREVMPWRVGYLVQLVFLIKGTLLSFVVWLPQDILGWGVPKVLREEQILLGECDPRAAGTPSPSTVVPGCHLRSWVWKQNAYFLPNSLKQQLLCRHVSLLFQEESPAQGRDHSGAPQTSPVCGLASTRGASGSFFPTLQTLTGEHAA